MSAAESDGWILRAEILHRGTRIVGSTVELGESTALVATEETAFVGDRVKVRLSFPGLLEPIELEAQVISHRLAGGPGEEAGWWLGWVFRSEAEGKSLRELLEGRSGESARAAPLRVLLVEDSRLTREVFQHRLERFFRGREATLSIDIAENGGQALQMLADRDYDLAIVDYYLPGENGDALITHIRSESRSRALPVLAISRGGEAREASFAAGADFFLRKPIAFDELYATLDRLKLERGAR